MANKHDNLHETNREEIVRSAQCAWQAMQKGERDQWPYWSRIALAIRLCRDDAMRQIGLDPHGETPQKNGKYNNAMTRHLKAVELQGVPRASRKAAIEAAPFIGQINEMRDALRQSSNPKDRGKYVEQQRPQAVWREYKKSAGWLEPKDTTLKGFLEMTVKEAINQDDNLIASELAHALKETRIRSIATALLERLSVPMRPVSSRVFDVPGDAKHGEVLGLLDSLGWDVAEKSRLVDSLGSDRIAEEAQVAELPPSSPSRQ